MKLLTAPIESLIWQDVIDYCSLDLPEGVNRDYKQDIPAELERTIVAMANTAGGVVVIGVEEDRKTTKPQMPLKGIPLVPGLNERILNICIGNISPILVPEVAVIPDPSNSLAVILLRIQQSHQSPHAVSKNTKIYLRRGSISNPEELATIDELEWLKQGRQRSVLLRDMLLSRADERFWQILRGFHEQRYTRELEKEGMLTLSFSPSFPKDVLRSPPELQELLFNSRVRDFYGTDANFPIGPAGGVLVQDGLVQQSSVNGSEWVHHTEVNAFGLLFFKQSLLHPVEIDGKRWKVIRASEVFARLDEMFDWARRFYSQIGYVGSVNFSMHLQNLIGSPLGKYSANETAFDIAYCPDNTVSYEATLNTEMFEIEKTVIVEASAKKMAWAYGWNMPSSLLAGYYKKYKGDH